jgi:ABC-type glycerol-3-phosphate transport system substrate-binding protein
MTQPFSRRVVLGRGAVLALGGVLAAACAAPTPPTATPAPKPADKPAAAPTSPPAAAASPATPPGAPTKPAEPTRPAGEATAAPKPGPEGSPATKPAAAQPATKGEPTRIEFVTNYDTKQRYWSRDTLFPLFEQQYNAKIDTVFIDYAVMDAKVNAAFAAKQLPDVIDAPTVNYTTGWLKAGIMRDMTDVLDALGRDDFPKNAVSAVTVKGKLGGIPALGYTHVFYIRKDVLSEKGLAVPKTWDDVQAVAKATTGKNAQGKDTYGFGAYLGQRHASSMYQNLLGPHGGYTFDKENKVGLNNPRTKEAWDRLIQLKPYFAPGAPTAIQGDLFALFTDGLLSQFMGSPSPSDSLIKTKPELMEKIAVVNIPTGPNGAPDRGPDLGAIFYAVTTGAKAPDKAREFLLWWFSPEIYTKGIPGTNYGQQPARRSVLEGTELPKLLPPVALEIAKVGSRALAVGTVPGQDFGANPIAFAMDGANFWTNMLNRVVSSDAAAATTWGEGEIKRLQDENPSLKP